MSSIEFDHDADLSPERIEAYIKEARHLRAQMLAHLVSEAKIFVVNKISALRQAPRQARSKPAPAPTHCQAPGAAALGRPAVYEPLGMTNV